MILKTIIESINTKTPDIKIIKKAVKIMKNGGLVIYPTETCYGIGVDATNGKAIKKIYKLKKRSGKKQIGIIVSDLKMGKKYCKITKEIEFLVKKFMPGPLTIVTEKKEILNGANHDNIAFRISSHPVASLLVKKLKKPVTSTSANLSGKDLIYTGDKIVKKFVGKVEMILDCGKLPKVKPSTYIKIKNEGIEIIREGPVTKKIIEKEIKRFRNKQPYRI